MRNRASAATAAFIVVVFSAALASAYDIAKDDDAKGSFKNVIESDVDMKGPIEKVTLVKVHKRDYADFDVVKDAKLNIESNGQVFSAPVNEPICYKSSGLENISVGDDAVSFIGVSSCMPHAEDGWKLILYSFDGKDITEQLKITSNEPSIEIKDSDNDGSKDIVVMDRDYENDPDKDKFITTYKYANGKWQRSSVYRTKTKELKELPLE